MLGPELRVGSPIPSGPLHGLLVLWCVASYNMAKLDASRPPSPYKRSWPCSRIGYHTSTMEHMVKHTPASHASILVAHLGLEQSSLKRHLANSFISFEPLFKPTLSIRPVQITLLKTATCVPPSPVLPLLVLIPSFSLACINF